MKTSIYYFYFIYLLLISSVSLGQISITFPTSRIVFQRDNNGNGEIPIMGQFSQVIDRVEARVVPMQGGQETGWQTIQNSPQGGIYSGRITVRGGWYQLEVRGMLQNQEVTRTELQRVGVGEVFLVAGQSNAQGFFNFGSPSSPDDRVNCVNYRNVTGQNSSLPQPTYEKVTEGVNMSPRGLSSWYWGRLGNLLASRLNVPILFYNAGWEGTLIKNWAETVDGGVTASMYVNGNYETGQPYGNLKLALNFYAATTGLRAILWHQGEADNLFSTSTTIYTNHLKTLINKSREHIGKNIAWVVARVSFYNAKGISQNIIDAQNTVINTTPNTYPGPNTDNIQTPRPDGAHFQDNGLVEVANAWNNALNDGFFNSATPSIGAFPTITTSCSNNNQLNVNVLGNNTVSWSNGSTGSSVSLNPGTYQATVRDGQGNYYYLPQISVNNELSIAPVSISVEGKLPLCIGSSVKLLSSSENGNRWSNGATSRDIEITSGGTYSVSNQNRFGCTTTTSIDIAAFQGTPPAKPTITASGSTVFCQGGEVTLTAPAAAEYRWSNGSKTQSIVARDGGTYQLRVLDSQGCISESTATTVQVNTPPAAPTITASGTTTFCQGGNVVLSSNYTSGNIWSSGEQARDITITKSGNYNVRFRDANGCDAISNTIGVIVNPLPPTPTITAEKPITFCEGDYTVLTSDNSAQYIWNNGETSRRITVRNGGDFSLTVIDQNGCSSAQSAITTVRVNPLPAAPTITANRSTTICENEEITLTSNNQTGYIWSNGETTQSVKVNLLGQYTARTVDANKCQSAPSNVITLTVLPLPPKPVITALSTPTFCEGGSVQLTNNYDNNLSWSTSETSKDIIIRKSGDYKVSYRDAAGCQSTSEPFTVTVNPLPAAPTIINEKPTSFCLYDNTVLTITSPGDLFEWNTGSNSKSITIHSAGDFSAKVTNLSTGCTSPLSTPIRVVVNMPPDKPTIDLSGPTTFCADQSITLTAPESGFYNWSNDAKVRSITVRETGNYSVVVRNQFGCISERSDVVSIRVNPLPDTPSIIAEGRTTFCEGDEVALRVESPLDVIWNTGETGKRIVVKQTGNYAARLKDQIGCLSSFTGALKVDVKPLPATPVIEKVGVFTLQITNPSSNVVYNWQNSTGTFATNKISVKANQSGNYVVFGSATYSPTLTCTSKSSTTFAFTLDENIAGMGIYPNPVATDKVKIETLEDLTNVTLSIYSANGQLIRSRVIPALNTIYELDVRELASGNYFIQLENPKLRATQKITISR